MEKLDIKKEKKDLFKGKDGEIREVFCKKAYYITLDGQGDPNTSQEYKLSIEALYQVGYTLKFMYKDKDLDFVVMPLSGLWWSDCYTAFTEDKKEDWKWRAMIEIPSFVTEEDIEVAKAKAFEKNSNNLVLKILHREMNEGKSFQVLHVGPYNEEGEKITKLHKVINEAGYQLRGKHHEIYLNDPRKVEKSKLKTIIRQSVFKEEEELLDFEETKNKFFNKIGKNKIMVLSTTDGEKVSARNMSIIIDEEKFYFQTDIEFNKYKDIERNKNVALCVDNIQVEAEVTKISSINDEDVKNFKSLFKEHNTNSYNAYSKLMGNRVFEVTPKIISLYKYEGNNVYREFIDFERKIAYKRWYLVF